MIGINPEYFLTIVEEKTLTRAAQKLFVSQSSLSQYLKRLEKNLGIELYEHGTSPLRLTYAGERYYKHVLQMKQQEENLRREFQDIQKDLCGVVRLGVPLWRGANLLPKVFPPFHEKYPQIRLELEEGSADQMIQALQNNQIDFCIINLPHSLDYSRFVCRKLCAERFLVAMPENHPLVREALQNPKMAHGNPVIPFEILERIPWIATKSGMNSTIEANHLLGKNHIEPEQLIATANLTTAINLAAEGMGFCFVPERGAAVCMRPGKIRYFEVDSPDHAWTLAVVHRRDVYLSRIAQLFIDELIQAYIEE